MIFRYCWKIKKIIAHTSSILIIKFNSREVCIIINVDLFKISRNAYVKACVRIFNSAAILPSRSRGHDFSKFKPHSRM